MRGDKINCPGRGGKKARGSLGEKPARLRAEQVQGLRCAARRCAARRPVRLQVGN